MDDTSEPGRSSLECGRSETLLPEDATHKSTCLKCLTIVNNYSHCILMMDSK